MSPKLPCPKGSVSNTGYRPCKLCPKGSTTRTPGKKKCPQVFFERILKNISATRAQVLRLQGLRASRALKF